MDNMYKIDLVLVVVSLVVLIGLVGYVRPLVIAPLDGYESSDNEILFVIEKADYLLVDDNFDFTTPDEYNIEDGLKLDLLPGKYYWKAVGLFEGEVRTLTINSEVSLELVEMEDGFGVVNVGNTKLNVDVYNGSELVETVKLGVSDKVSGGDKFVGRQE